MLIINTSYSAGTTKGQLQRGAGAAVLLVMQAVAAGCQLLPQPYRQLRPCYNFKPNQGMHTHFPHHSDCCCCKHPGAPCWRGSQQMLSMRAFLQSWLQTCHRLSLELRSCAGSLARRHRVHSLAAQSGCEHATGFLGWSRSHACSLAGRHRVYSLAAQSGSNNEQQHGLHVPASG